ncbi:unnamed protein product, partial [marine sediment metagenome]
ILIFDEAAYIEAGDDFWAAIHINTKKGGILHLYLSLG